MFLIVYFSLHFEAFESFQRLVLSSFDDKIDILGSVHHVLKIGNHLSMDFLSFSSSKHFFKHSWLDLELYFNLLMDFLSFPSLEVPKLCYQSTT